MSLDIEGAEFEAMRAFPFDKYTFRALTIERPSAALRQLLRDRSNSYLHTHGCFGDQMWVHNSLAKTARTRLQIKSKPPLDFVGCCDPDSDEPPTVFKDTIESNPPCRM